MNAHVLRTAIIAVAALLWLGPARSAEPNWPDSLTSAAARPVTTTPPQALFFLNNPHVRSAATAFAATLKPFADKDPAAAVQRAYQMAFARSPTEDETALGVEYLAKGEKALESYALALFGLHEFIYVD